MKEQLVQVIDKKDLQVLILTDGYNIHHLSGYRGHTGMLVAFQGEQYILTDSRARAAFSGVLKTPNTTYRCPETSDAGSVETRAADPGRSPAGLASARVTAASARSPALSAVPHPQHCSRQRRFPQPSFPQLPSQSRRPSHRPSRTNRRESPHPRRARCAQLRRPHRVPEYRKN